MAKLTPDEFADSRITQDDLTRLADHFNDRPRQLTTFTDADEPESAAEQALGEYLAGLRGTFSHIIDDLDNQPVDMTDGATSFLQMIIRNETSKPKGKIAPHLQEVVEEQAGVVKYDEEKNLLSVGSNKIYAVTINHKNAVGDVVREVPAILKVYSCLATSRAEPMQYKNNLQGKSSLDIEFFQPAKEWEDKMVLMPSLNAEPGQHCVTVGNDSPDARALEGKIKQLDGWVDALRGVYRALRTLRVDPTLQFDQGKYFDEDVFLLQVTAQDAATGHYALTRVAPIDFGAPSVVSHDHDQLEHLLKCGRMFIEKFFAPEQQAAAQTQLQQLAVELGQLGPVLSPELQDLLERYDRGENVDIPPHVAHLFSAEGA